MNENQGNNLDILRRIEGLTSEIDQKMKKRSEAVLQRYPLTFAFLVLLGAMAVAEGVKGIFKTVGFEEHPLYLLLGGLVILTITGTLYKKLDK